MTGMFGTGMKGWTQKDIQVITQKLQQYLIRRKELRDEYERKQQEEYEQQRAERDRKLKWEKEMEDYRSRYVSDDVNANSMIGSPRMAQRSKGTNYGPSYEM